MESEDIYIRVLIWAHRQGHIGFTRQRLIDEFKLSGALHQWVEKQFFGGPRGGRPLISRIRETNGEVVFALTERGKATAIDYLQLKEARRSAGKAQATAFLAIIITLVSALASIGLSVYQVMRPQEIKIDSAQIELLEEALMDSE